MRLRFYDPVEVVSGLLMRVVTFEPALCWLFAEKPSLRGMQSQTKGCRMVRTPQLLLLACMQEEPLLLLSSILTHDIRLSIEDTRRSVLRSG